MKKMGFILLFGLLGWIGISIFGSFFATRPRPLKNMPKASHFFDVPVEQIQLKSKDSTVISAWYIPSKTKDKAVILLNGIGGNKTGLINHAKLYLSNGFSVFMPDLRGTGGSEGKAITFGWYERWDFLAALQFLEKKEYSTIGGHGLSLGAATIVYSVQEQEVVDFVILESCYDNIEQTFQNRLDKMKLPYFVMVLLVKITEWRLQITTKNLTPDWYIQALRVPTLILAGDSEQKVKPEETKRLFERCGTTEKTLHFITDAIHVNFYNHEQYQTEYLNYWETFMKKYAFIID